MKKIAFKSSQNSLKEFEMLSENSNIDWNFNEYFQTYYMSEDYKDWPEYKMMYEHVESFFQRWIFNFKEFGRKIISKTLI